MHAILACRLPDTGKVHIRHSKRHAYLFIFFRFELSHEATLRAPACAVRNILSMMRFEFYLLTCRGATFSCKRSIVDEPTDI